jgi:hypothetical protein
VCEAIRGRLPEAIVESVATASDANLKAALGGRTLVIAAGAAGATLLPRAARVACSELRVAIDLNAVPPVGIEGVEVMDQATPRDGVLAYGAVGVGQTKMKIHKTAVARLFESNDQVLDAEEVCALAAGMAE